MTKPSSQKQAGQKFNQLQNRGQNIENLTIKSSNLTRLQVSPRQERQVRQERSLKAKAVVWALAVSTIPVLAVGTATYFLGNQLITKQIAQARLVGVTGLAETEALHGQLLLLLIGTGVTAVLAGAISAIVANRALRRVRNAAVVSTTIVNRLSQEILGTRAPVASKDELVVLETNISLIKEQLLGLLWKQETEAEREQVLMNISRSLRESLSEEDVLRTTVEEVRLALKIDRVAIFRFNPNWDGTVVAESVASGLPKMLWATVLDPDFEAKYVEQYQDGHVRAIDDIYQADLSDRHIELLERFAVRSNLIAPILNNDQLFGLLIAHQCARPYFWQQSEIYLFAQIATQVGFALDYARRLEQIEKKAEQAEVFIDITHRIRQSLNEEDVLATTVEFVRKALRADRVVVYSFDTDSYGTVIAESVLPGFPKALRAKIRDSCFAQGYLEKYQAGRVQATNNIYEAGLTDCYIRQLESFAVKANLVAPILKDDQLFGLLIAHQCSGPRDWQQFEIDLFAQIATQVGFALDHARLLDQVEQAYQAAEATSNKQRQQQEVFQHQASQLLRSSEIVVQTLSTEVALNQMESITSTYNQLQTLVDSAWGMVATAQQAELQQQQLSQTLQEERESMNRILDSICATRETVVEAEAKVRRLDEPSQKLSVMVNVISNVVFQFKLQAMHTALEASRTPLSGQKFASIAQNILSLVQQLDSEIAQIKPLVASIQTETNEVIAAMESGAQQAISGTELVEEQEQKLDLIVTVSDQMKTLVTELAQAAALQAQTLTTANQSILGVANSASQTSQQAQAMAESIADLAAKAQYLQQRY